MSDKRRILIDAKKKRKKYKQKYRRKQKMKSCSKLGKDDKRGNL